MEYRPGKYQLKPSGLANVNNCVYITAFIRLQIKNDRKMENEKVTPRAKRQRMATIVTS